MMKQTAGRLKAKKPKPLEGFRNFFCSETRSSVAKPRSVRKRFRLKTQHGRRLSFSSCNDDVEPSVATSRWNCFHLAGVLLTFGTEDDNWRNRLGFEVDETGSLRGWEIASVPEIFMSSGNTVIYY